MRPVLNRRSLFVLAGASALLSACGGDEKVTTLRIGAVGGAQGRNSSTGNVTIAQANGLFDQEFAKDGIRTRVVYYVGTGPAINEAFAQGQLDFAEYGGLPNVIGLAGGAPTKLLIARHSASSYNLAVSTAPGRPDIQSIEQMKGRRVALQMGTMPHILLIKLLERHGLSEKDVEVVNLQNAEANAAFTAGAVDALFGSTPILLLRDKGQARILGTSKELPPGLNLGGFLVHRDFEKKHPDITTRVTKVMVRSYNWASRPENRDALLALYGRSGVPIRYYSEDYPAPLKDRFSPLIDPQVRAGYRQIADFALSRKLIRTEPDFESWFDPSHQQTALKELGLDGYWTAA
jgi:sulfonate transport system substrate-binding protein